MRELVSEIHKSGVCKDPAKLNAIKEEGIRLGLIAKTANLSCGSCVWDMICKMKNYYEKIK